MHDVGDAAGSDHVQKETSDCSSSSQHIRLSKESALMEEPDVHDDDTSAKDSETIHISPAKQNAEVKTAGTKQSES